VNAYRFSRLSLWPISNVKYELGDWKFFYTMSNNGIYTSMGIHQYQTHLMLTEFNLRDAVLPLPIDG
jgi:hypothetical protein